MSDLKLVLYTENRAPKSVALNTRTIYKTLLTASICAIALIALSVMAIRLYFTSPANISPNMLSESLTEISETDQSPTAQIVRLRDKVDELESKLRNQEALENAPKVIDKSNPALALFGPNIVDQTKTQHMVITKNFNFIPASPQAPATFSFELHNAKQGERVQKGYIIVLARTARGLQSYPDVFKNSGPYLIDFVKGETFQVARFRMVNAQFDFIKAPENFQILIFTREGELLVNSSYKVNQESLNQNEN